jgi:hypothetical protein
MCCYNTVHCVCYRICDLTSFSILHCKMKFHCYCFIPTPTIYRRLELVLSGTLATGPNCEFFHSSLACFSPPFDIATIKSLCDFYYHIFQMFFGCSNLSTLFHHTPSQATKLNFLVIGWQRVSCSVFISIRYYNEKCAALYPYYLGCIPYAEGSTVAWLLLQRLPPITS